MSSDELDGERGQTPTNVTAVQASTPIVENLIDVGTTDLVNQAVSSISPVTTEHKSSKHSSPVKLSIIDEISALEEQLSPLNLNSSSIEYGKENKTPYPSSKKTNITTCSETIAQGYQGSTSHCDNCKTLQLELAMVKADKSKMEGKISELEKYLVICRNELDREVQKRVEFEQQFTEKSDRVKDQIAEFIAKSTDVNSKCEELSKKLEFYNRNSSTMSEHFTTNREVLTSQLLQLRNENDYVLGQYLRRAQELQSAEIDLPQSVEELQFHCLTLNEKLILATMAKERLEEILIRDSASVTPALSNTTMSA